MVGLAFIVAAIFFAAAIISPVTPSNIGIRFVLLGLGVFAFEWGGTPFGGVGIFIIWLVLGLTFSHFFSQLGKKLASGLYCTLILGSAKPAATQLSIMDSALALTAGLAIGYLGALIG